MTPSFVEELFMRIEERLSSLENEITGLKLEMVSINSEMKTLNGCRTEMENISRYFWLGRGIVLAVWGFIVTALNVVIGKLLDNR